MNQDLPEKKAIFFEKKFVRRVSPDKKNSCTTIYKYSLKNVKSRFSRKSFWLHYKMVCGTDEEILADYAVAVPTNVQRKLENSPGSVYKYNIGRPYF